MALPLGATMMLKAMGIDAAEVEAFGSQAGQIVADFRGRFDRIESDLKRILNLLETQNDGRNAGNETAVKQIEAPQPRDEAREITQSWP